MSKLANSLHVFDKKVISHRGDSFLKQMYVPAPLREIDGEVYVLGVLWDDTKWWLLPSNNHEQDAPPDIGPFDEFDDALIHLKLMSDTAPKEK
jgi:hypothetical protein